MERPVQHFGLFLFKNGNSKSFHRITIQKIGEFEELINTMKSKKEV